MQSGESAISSEQTTGQDDQALARQIEQRLTDEAGIYAEVRVERGVVSLSGLVDSDAQSEAANDLAYGVAGVTQVQNYLEVEEFEAAVDDNARASDNAMRADVSYQMLEGEAGQRPEPLEPDFNEPIPTVGSDMTDDQIIAVEEGIPYMPPTDPVVRPTDDEQQLEIVGGFGETSMEEFPDQLATTAYGDAPAGDEDIRSQVLEALHTDAATIDLDVHVSVRNGVVHLRGHVPTLDDAEFAEEVAGRVPGVVEVREELHVDAIER